MVRYHYILLLTRLDLWTHEARPCEHIPSCDPSMISTAPSIPFIDEHLRLAGKWVCQWRPNWVYLVTDIVTKPVYLHFSIRIFHSDRNCDTIFSGGDSELSVLWRKYLAASWGSTASLIKEPRIDRSGWGTFVVITSKALYWGDVLSWKKSRDAEPRMFHGMAMTKSPVSWLSWCAFIFQSIACRTMGSCFYTPWNGWDTIPKWEKLVCCLVAIARRRASPISWHQSCTSSITTLDFLCKSGSAPWSFCQFNCYDGVIGALLDTCQWSALPKLRYSS